MYLIDTNIFLEMLLKQDKAEKAAAFFEKVNTSTIFISEFTIYSTLTLMMHINMQLRKNITFR